jgi:predicted lipoprotein with Yx(FWY)xxD motif
MRTRHRVGSVLAALVMVGTVMAWASPTVAGGSPVLRADHYYSPPPSGPPTVELARSPEGLVLVTGAGAATPPGAATNSGFALYEFSGDAFPPAEIPPVPVLQFNCTASNTTTRFTTGAPGGTPCTKPWPPLMANGPLVAGRGVSQAGLSIATTSSGYTPGQVLYFGHPLYTFVKDTPGTYVGEDVAAFGGLFWLVSRNGLPNPGVASVGTEVSPAGVALSTTTASGGRTLYMLSFDTPGSSEGGYGPQFGPPAVSSCTGACVGVWPPLLTTGWPKPGPGVNPRLIGEVRRPDGTTQVTYAGWPVYQYFADLAPGAGAGETNGQYLLDNMADGVWYEVAPQGGPNPGTARLTSVDGLLAATSAAFPPQNPDATVYTLSSDTTPGTSTCSGTCAKFWPPVLTSTAPSAMGLTGTASTIQRADGTFQVTYNGHPLYFFSQNMTSGDTGGASISTPFGTFSVVTP